MKKYLLISLLSLVTFASATAEKKDVIINPMNNTSSSEGTKPERSPIRTPYVSIEDYTLYFDISCIGCTIDLFQGDVIVYSDVVDGNGEVLLPSNFSGVYQLQLQFGSITFVGDIEL